MRMEPEDFTAIKSLELWRTKHKASYTMRSRPAEYNITIFLSTESKYKWDKSEYQFDAPFTEWIEIADSFGPFLSIAIFDAIWKADAQINILRKL